MSFNPQGSRILTASGDKTARLWDTATGHCIQVRTTVVLYIPLKISFKTFEGKTFIFDSDCMYVQAARLINGPRPQNLKKTFAVGCKVAKFIVLKDCKRVIHHKLH